MRRIDDNGLWTTDHREPTTQRSCRYGATRAVCTAGASWTNATLPSAWVESGLKMREGVLSIIASISGGFISGFSERMRAAMPAMIGAANDVPDRRFGERPR